MSGLESLLHDDDSAVSHLIANYVPHAIISTLMDKSVPDPTDNSNLPVVSSYETSCLVLEISGMADLSVTMAKNQGKVYLGYVGIIMNQLKREGGDLIKMDEDTFVCVWPRGGKSPAERARHAAQCAVSVYRDFFSMQQKSGDSSLKIRSGVGHGDMSFLHLGGQNEEIEYVAIGKVLSDAFEAVSQCKPGEILVSADTFSVLGNAFNATKSRRQGNPYVMDYHVACNVRTLLHHSLHSTPLTPQLLIIDTP